VNKLHIKRSRHHWTIEQEGVMVDCTLYFRQACAIAAEWYREGWIVAKGWTKR
jgi:hypothetical protein